MEERVPILLRRPRLEVVEGDVGELTAERCAIDREADTVEPLVHLGAVLTHALADDVQRDLEIDERATGDTREDGDDRPQSDRGKNDLREEGFSEVL